MHIVVSGGGTAGHIYPALAFAQIAKDNGDNVTFAGVPGSLEESLAKKAGVDFVGFQAKGFNRAKPLSLITSTNLIMKSSRLASDWIRKNGVDLVLGFGGYVSIPVGRAALKNNIPLVCHEQNSYMGMANKYFLKRANGIALTYSQALTGLSASAKVLVTGNPVRKNVLQANREESRKNLGLCDDDVLLTVFGGSLGAKQINSALIKLKAKLLSIPNLRIVQITGPSQYDSVCSQLGLSAEEKNKWSLHDYVDDMPEVLSASDIVLSRAGATSLAEISALSLPAILVPYPYATGDHQTKNAHEYVNSGCAKMIADAEILTDKFQTLLMECVTDKDIRNTMKANSKKQNGRNAGKDLYDFATSFTCA